MYNFALKVQEYFCMIICSFKTLISANPSHVRMEQLVMMAFTLTIVLVQKDTMVIIVK